MVLWQYDCEMAEFVLWVSETSSYEVQCPLLRQLHILKVKGNNIQCKLCCQYSIKILKCKKLCDHPNCVEQGECCNHHVNISADFYLLWNWLPKPGSEKEQLPHWDAEISCITNIVSKNIYINEPSRFLCLVDIYSTETEALTWGEAVGG